MVMKLISRVFWWLWLSGGLIWLSLVCLYWQTKNPSSFSNSVAVNGTQTVNPESKNQVEAADGRPALIAQFLARYKSPLQPYDYFGQFLVEIADKYGIDFRLLPAIAMQESNLCKAAPAGTYNCLGFGIHKRGTLGFESYEAGFERAAKELKANYIDQGRTTPEQIMKKYTPSSNGSWADSVNQWMAEMRYDDRQMGISSSDSANVLEYARPATASPNGTNNK